MRWGIILAALAVSGCSNSASFDYETVTKRELRDPNSAEFSEVTVDANVACGFVNSKNGYGGYSGRLAFVASHSNAQIIDNPTAEDLRLVYDTCPDPAKGVLASWITDRVAESLR